MTLTRAVKNGSKYGPARIKQVRDRSPKNYLKHLVNVVVRRENNDHCFVNVDEQRVNKYE